VEVFVGKVAGEIEGLESVTSDYEVFSAPGLLAVFVPKPQSGAVRDCLAQRGFASLPVPEGEGDPRDILSELLAERDRWESRLKEIEERLDTLRERYADFLAAAKARLEVTVEKAEAPLRFAVTDHTFIVEGWVPTESFARLEADLGRLPGLFVTELEHDHESQAGEEGSTEDPPVLLRNAKPLRPFEMLVTLFSTPSYHEIDPTFILTFTFPIFFGLMVGDAGYGIAWLAVGALLLRKGAKEPGAFRDLVIAITWGGFWSLLFGVFFFGEALGIPFHHPALATTRVELLDWSSILGFSIPIHTQLEKLSQVTDFIVLSIAAAYVHLAIAFVVGFVNDVGHNKRHALGKIAWLFILTGLFVVMIARSARWPVDAEGRTPYGYLIWNRLLGWFPRDGILYLSIGFGPSNPIPWLSVGMLVGGIGLLVASEGLLHLMEFFGLMANMVSYARLAAVGVAKAAMAFAFNVIVLETLIFPGLDGGNFVLVILGFVLGFVFHAIVFLLGAVSAAIQAIRLNYVEFFIKFFEGAGRAFRPFGEKAKPEV
jgi:V/A-type H+-transporting ATPase subunit I